MVLLTLLPRRACRLRLRLGFANISSIPPPRSVTAWLTSSSTRFPGPGLGSWLSLTPPRLTSLPRFLGSVSAGVFACPSGHRTPTALFAGRCWTSGEITLWLVGAVGIGSLVTTSSATSSTQLPMIVPTWLQFSRSLAFLFLVTLLTRIAHQTRTHPTQPISLVDRQMCGSHGALVLGPEAWDFSVTARLN